jgi:Ca-activated chloride channel homolog
MNTTLLLDHDAPAPDGSLVVRALLTIEGELPTDARRAPLNLSLVLDRSGSMSGDRLRAAKEAAVSLVRRLWPDDRVSVVAYGDDVEVVSPPARGRDVSRVARRIGGILIRGSTNLSGGWLKGRELVATGARKGGMDRVILLTDGHANMGITDPDTLAGLVREAAEQGVTTTTVGFGENYNEVLLRTLADAGGGNSYYVERPDQAVSIFEEEMDGLLSVSAQNVSVEVRPGGDARILGIRHSYPHAPAGEGIRVTLGDLYARDPLTLLVEFRVEGPAGADELELGTLVIHGNVVTEGGGVEYREITCQVRMTGAEGPRVEQEVRREILLVETAGARDRALELELFEEFEAAAEVLRQAAAAIRAQGYEGEERLGDEARDLDSLARRVENGWMNAMDRKYMFQRSHEAARGKKQAFRKLSREMRKD